MDQIIIEEVEVFYRIGVPDEERAEPQRLLITVAMGQDFAVAATTDKLLETVDYYAVTKRLQTYGNDRTWKLIETLAVELAELILREFKPYKVTVEVKKFILPQTKYVGVKVTRPRG